MTDLILERFWKYVKVQPNGCWNWTGAKYLGYGEFWYGKKKVHAYRFSYEVNKGKVPKGLHLDHLCRNPSCVNPDHLEAVTRKTNLLRGIGACAKNSRKTKCHNGHELSGKNLIIEKNGSRRCRTCHYNNINKYKPKLGMNH